MKKEEMCKLTENEMLTIEGGKSAFSKASFITGGVVLAVESVVLGVTCQPVVGVAAMGTAIACIKAAQD